jgi:putative nucleotidyltransferase with HDIG domain
MHVCVQIIGASKELFEQMIAYDRSTALHCYRVEQLAMKFVATLNLSHQIIQDISRAALLHDLGKIKIPKAILNKPRTLADAEFKIIQKHAEYGFTMLKEWGQTKNILDAVLYHHEKYNGTGYPEGRRCENIPLIARILSIVDVYEAITSNRPYRTAMMTEEALIVIKEGKGSHFDPILVDAFLQQFRLVAPEVERMTKG